MATRVEVFVRGDAKGTPKSIGVIDGDGLELGHGGAIWMGALKSRALIALLQQVSIDPHEVPFMLDVDGQVLPNCRIRVSGGRELLGGLDIESYG